MKTPGAVVWIKRLLLLRFIFMLLILVVTIAVIYLNPETGFFTGFTKAILANIEKPLNNSDFAAGQVTGLLLLPILFTIAEYLFLLKRKSLGFWITFGLESLFAIANHNFPLLQIVILTLGISKSTQLYFQSVPRDTIAR